MKFHLKLSAVELCVQVTGWKGVCAVGMLCAAWVLTTVFGFYPVMP